MATLSTHTLNSLDGSHAGGIAIHLYRLDGDTRSLVLRTATDDGGRMMETIDLSDDDAGASFEMVLGTGDYFRGRAVLSSGLDILPEVVIRFTMPDPNARYHIPMMLAPNSYSVWWSA